ncbi:MAG: hypothetical protein AB8B99_18525 [Phormidesmis sp.]
MTTDAEGGNYALPVNYIKIDGKFTYDIDPDPIAIAIVEAINDVGHVMGLKNHCRVCGNRTSSAPFSQDWGGLYAGRQA